MYLQGSDTGAFIRSGGNFLQAPKVTMQIDERFLSLRDIYKLSEGMQISDAQFAPLQSAFGNVVEGLIRTGLVVRQKEQLSLTTRGRFWAGNISAQFSRKIRELLLSD